MAFSFRAGTNWHHDFPKLARESGFYFNARGSRIRVDWNRINAIDIDRVICERDFSTIDQNINNVVDYCLESEYDVKILDSNFVKLFRLAQLSVEYLLYCKQYLDHGVMILKDELRQKIEQNISMKKEIATLGDTIKSLKERSREKRKLIETSVGEISNGEIYKCPHCPKTFVRAIFVNAHIARKHSYISDIGVSISPVHEHYRAETEKLHNEIKTLKERLNQTERVIRNESDKLLDSTEKNYLNISKNEHDISNIDRFEAQRKYQEDIGSLKNMLLDEIRALRGKDHDVNKSVPDANVKILINQQEKEIESLRSQLLERLTPGMENMQVKLQTQENYWKTKIGDMEAQHRQDIERLTTELKATQQAADHIKSEYASKVHDLEKQSMDQSNMLVEQRKQLNSLSREINNSQINNHKIREKDTVEEFHKSPLSKVKHDNNYNDSKTYHKSLNSTGNIEMVIEDVSSESSRECSGKLMSQDQYMTRPNKEYSTKDIDNKNFITDLNRITKYTTTRSNLKSSDRSEAVKRDKVTRYNTSGDTSRINDHTSKSFTKDNASNNNVNKKYTDIKNVERKKIQRIEDTKDNTKTEFFEKHSANTTTESESSLSTIESRSDSESVTVDEDVMVKKYETSVIRSPLNIRTLSMQEDVRSRFDNRLRELGIDPEWQGIPAVTFKQKMEIIRYQQTINAKKFTRYNQIKQKILEDVLQRISSKHKESKHATLTKSSPLNKLVTHAKSKAWKAFGDHKDNDKHTSIQKAENTTPKLRLKQHIELLPKKYKDDSFENTRESPLKRSEVNVYSSPKVIPTYPRSIRNISSASSIESQEDIKQISSTKITVSGINTRKVNSPIGKKHVVTPKFSENNESDSTIVQQDDSILSPKNNKSVLKPMSGSVGSLVKKKVLFDLDDKKDNGAIISENDQRGDQINNYDWNISSSPEGREYVLQKAKSMSTSNIVLKTSQSDKIAEISKKIQEQLNIVRKPPVGSVETIFRSSNTNSQDLTNYIENQLLHSTDLASSITNSPARNFTSPKAKGSDTFPQPAPRTLRDLAVTRHKSEIKYSDLDSDIDEILQME